MVQLAAYRNGDFVIALRSEFTRISSDYRLLRSLCGNYGDWMLGLQRNGKGFSKTTRF